MQKSLLPISDVTKFQDKEGNIIIPRYNSGNPRDYRLDLSKGVLNVGGTMPLTKAGKEFKIIPIAFRTFVGEVFGNPSKKWGEVYFLNERGHLSMFMLHSYSLQNLSTAFAQTLYYEGLELSDAVWTVKFEKKKNKDGAGYYMAFFEFEELKEEGRETIKAVVKGVHDNQGHICRDETAKLKPLYSLNWSSIMHLGEVGEKIEAKRQEELIKHLEGDKTDKKSEPESQKATA